MKNYKYAILAVLFSLVLFLRECQHRKKIGQKDLFAEALMDEMEQYRNKTGQQVSRIKALEADMAKDLTSLHIADSTVVWLQSVVSKQKRVIDAMVLETETAGEESQPSVVLRRDTIVRNDTVFVFPEYRMDWNNEWSSGKVAAGQDSINVQYRLVNRFEVTHQRTRKDGLLLTVTNLNPYTVTNELQSFKIKESRPRWNIGLQAGYGLGLSDRRMQPFLGLGIGFKIN